MLFVFITQLNPQVKRVSLFFSILMSVNSNLHYLKLLKADFHIKFQYPNQKKENFLLNTFAPNIFSQLSFFLLPSERIAHPVHRDARQWL